ncbi:hypothetical protein [Clostridium tertium]|jgi:hypothetical protein|uniref:hypothetical protein n=1 Tax=Clostridium tertium TaxID=1559 RepID=UPI001AE75222|nr:hypothetical protein [Clostridium tertium]MBP1868799.1 hypothetical protein [Clostridium tertium]
MKIKLGDYFIETDERQFKVKKYLGKDKDGEKDLYKTYAYCTTLSTALKFIPQQAIRDNDDISVVIDKLTQIERDIKAIDEYVKENENYKERYEELNRYIELNYESEGV